MKRFATALAFLLLMASAYAQTVVGLHAQTGMEANLRDRSSFCLGVYDGTFDQTVRGPLLAALLRQAELYGFPARDCPVVTDEPGWVRVTLLSAGSAIAVRTSVAAFNVPGLYVPDVWGVSGLTVGGTGSVADRAWPLIREQFEQLVLAWRAANR